MKRVAWLVSLPFLWACQDRTVDASDRGTPGAPCTRSDGTAVNTVDPGDCGAGLVCEPIAGSDPDPLAVCGFPFEVRGQVVDAVDDHAIAGALVSALDETGAPVDDVVVTDADGRYALTVSARRDPEADDGRIADSVRWTLFCTARDYQPFPGGVRPAIPIDATDAIDGPSTRVALIPLPAGTGGRTVTGRVGGAMGSGTLVVAEGQSPAPFTIADRSGDYTLFNVASGPATIVGHRQGLALEPVAINGDGDLSGIDLAVVHEGVDALPIVSGSVNLVNAPGGARTSVVLIPTSVFDEVLERGPVPYGLRAPQAPLEPSIEGAFTIAGVPPGHYTVLAAFENDGLVRDPDLGIAGTTIQEIEVAADDLAVAESFKITESLVVLAPGAEHPETVRAPFDLVWADDASEDAYELVVFDALGHEVWRTEVPRVTGSDEVRAPYDGPALVPGMYYQFRAQSVRDRNDGRTAIARTEDLRGVFVFE